jgi:hypothetical protein
VADQTGPLPVEAKFKRLNFHKGGMDVRVHPTFAQEFSVVRVVVPIVIAVIVMRPVAVVDVPSI